MNKVFNKIMKDSLYRNSIYLMLSTGVMAVLGFIFWIICARLYSAENIGLATTIISIMGLIASFSLLGIGQGLIRFLAGSSNKNNKINTGFTIVGLTAIVVSSLFLIGLKKFSPELLFIKDHLGLSFIFIISMVLATFNSLMESIFVAFRSTKYSLLKNSIFSTVKVVLPFLLVSFGTYGIFGSWMIGIFAGVLTSFIILIRKFGYSPKIVFHDKVMKKIGKYSLGNYIAGFIGGLSLLVLPLLITNSLGPERTAYYYIAMQIVGLLFVIPSAATNSLFAEGSYDENGMSRQINKSRRIIFLLLIPSILAIIFLGNYVLLAFGKDYSSQGFMLLRIMALSGIFVGINAIYGSVLRVKKNIGRIIYVSTIGTIAILGGSFWAIHEGYGLMGVGVSYLLGQAVMSLSYFVGNKIKK